MKINEAISRFDDIVKEMTSCEQKTVIDHHICYGKEVPLCGQPLGKKGLINKIEYITCPQCLEKLKK